ncbi:hypothetical protein BN949_02828 [Agrobacterium tumefaciens]|nr:hypothetical protein BN949_02828 [Agrobacterium tumefaciens]
MKRSQPRPAFLDQDQAEACLELWSSKKFDTNDIARILRVPEHAVSRLIQAARDLARAQA